MFEGEDAQAAFTRCMLQRLNVSEDECQRYLEVISITDTKEVQDSPGFPGLTTSYDLHVVRARLCEDTPECVMNKLGLPEAGEFSHDSESAGLQQHKRREFKWCSEDVIQRVRLHSGRYLLPD